MVFVENLKFWNISLLGKEVRESVFLYSIWWKIAILDDKNVDLLMMKKSKFSKGDIMVFVKNWKVWYCSFLNFLGVEKVLC